MRSSVISYDFRPFDEFATSIGPCGLSRDTVLDARGARWRLGFGRAKRQFFVLTYASRTCHKDETTQHNPGGNS